MMHRSLIVLDDYKRSAEGVNNAVAEFIEAHDDWRVLPLFPAQGLMFDRSWFDPFDDDESSGASHMASKSPESPGRGS